jgi:hypothetical protein
MDFKALGAKAVAEGADQTKAQSGGGGDYEAPAAGPCQLRFVAYVELGKQKGIFQGKPQIKDKVQLVFELVGKRHPARTLEDGTVIPHRVTVVENYSLNEKAHFFKLFTRMNYKQTAQHIVQLLGEGFKGELFHDKWTGKDGKERTDVTLKSEAGYSIAPPRKEDEDSETGWVDLVIPPAHSTLKAFLWEQADLEQWGSLFIEGEYPERKDDKTGAVVAKAKSKNVLQDKIKQATNFVGSPIHTLLVAGGQAIDIPAMDEQEDDVPGKQQAAQPSSHGSTPTTSPSNDALGGIV